ncbi:helix-turn-helix domain-containing protein [Natrinema halophilum]|uniref:helix-turn-helix domain-containing protein n=1 Tax=Natrinema halophilum TaxID=1699371 RepID=UPI001F2DA51B|nr:helix-turn-helix domain-containing protein [Natrinema halophilum]UHQ96262.1 helix-turn-helix domain-containing protein [Natrinema halophilum]
MAQAEEQQSGDALLTLEIWHPDCWTLEVTDEAPASLLAQTVFNAADGRVKGHFTVYGDSTEDIDRLVQTAAESRLTHSVTEMQNQYGVNQNRAPPGNATRELLVEYDPENTISDALASHGFIQEGPVRVQNGTEYWSVFVSDDDRDRLNERLDDIRDSHDAEITVTKIASQSSSGGNIIDRIALLSERQREIFELACRHDYYAWPREVTTRELADEAGVSKTTLLEHLRKAEAKLLDPAIDEATDSL